MRGILALLAGLTFLALSACAGPYETARAGDSCKTHEDGLPYWRKGDYAAAAHCWKPGAEAGNARDRMALGMALDRLAAKQVMPMAEIPNPTLDEAEHWLRLAARQQLPSAEYEYGQFIANHWCYPKKQRCEEVRDLFMKAQIGHEERAQFALEILSSTPSLAVTDYELAYRIIHSDGDPRIGNMRDAELEVDARIRPFIPESLLKTKYPEIPFGRLPNAHNRLFTGELLDLRTYIDVAGPRSSRKEFTANYPENCDVVRRMAEGGDVMAMYAYGLMLSVQYKPKSWTGNSCLEGDAEAWFSRAVDNGLTLAFRGIAVRKYSSCWGTGTLSCNSVAPLFERAIKMGDREYAHAYLFLPSRDDRLASYMYFSYIYYFKDKKWMKDGFITGQNGWSLRGNLELLTEDEKLKIEQEAMTFEPDYP